MISLSFKVIAMLTYLMDLKITDGVWATPARKEFQLSMESLPHTGITLSTLLVQIRKRCVFIC